MTVSTADARSTFFGALLTRRRMSTLLVAALFVASVISYWHGFGPGDAERYARAALDWTREGFHLGVSHWALRYPFVLPMALSFALFGVSEFTATIPNIVYAGAAAAITLHFARRYLGELEGTIAAAFVATSAFFVARPIELDVYGAEAFFIAVACWLFVGAEFERRRYALLTATGVAAGFAWLLREQTVYLMPVFGVLTLWSRKDVWRSLLALGFGFGAILVGEWLFYATAAGDPFYRYRVDLNHRYTGVEITIKGADASPLAMLIRPFKDLATYPTTTPFIVLAALAAVALGWRFLANSPPRRRSAVVFAAMSAVAVPVCAYAFNLSFPRYYPVLTYAAFLVLAAATAEIWRRHGRLAGVAAAAIVTVINAAAADFSRYKEYSEARVLADVAVASGEPIAADPLTASRARFQLVLRGFEPDEAARRIPMTREPVPGTLYFKSRVTPVRAANWCPVDIIAIPPTNWTHVLLRRTGIGRYAGTKIRSVVALPPPVEVVRVMEEEPQPEPVSGRPCVAEARQGPGPGLLRWLSGGGA